MTRLLAIETSGRSGSIALLEGGKPVLCAAEATLPRERRTAQALAPAMHELLDRAGWTPRSLNVVAVVVGPGSFTGLRIGVTAAKTLAYAVGADVVGVGTMDVLAEPNPVAGRLWTVVDAQRNELFAATFLPDTTGRWRVAEATKILARDVWLAQLEAGDVVTGPIVARLAELLPADVTVTDPTLHDPTAASVARVAWRAYQDGQRDDVWQLRPDYYRRSAAEEKLG